MARFNVGEAFLQVVASVSGIHEKIAAEVAKIRDIEIDVTPNMEGFRERIATEVAGIQDIEIDVTPNLTGFREKVAAETSRIRDVRVNVDPVVNTAKADVQVGAFATKMKTTLDAAIKSIADFRFGADSSEVERKIAAIRAQLVTIREQSTRWDFDEAAGLAKLKALQAELAALSNKTVDVKVRYDTSQASQALAALEAQGTSLIAKFSNANLGSTMFAGIGAALTSIGQLSGALGLIPAVATGAATALGAVVIGAQGVGDALQAASKAEEAAAQGGEKAKAAADAYAASLQNLAPSARSFVSAIVQLKPAFDSLRLDVQQHLFQGIGDALLQLGNTALPVVRTGLTQMADGLSEAARNVASFASSKEAVDSYRKIFDNIGAAAHNLAGAVQPILQIFTDLAEVGSEFLPGLAKSFADAAQKAADFIRNAKETGQLKQWIQTGLDAVKELWGAFKDVVAIIKDLTVSPGFGPNFLEALHAVTSGIRWFIENVPGATTLVKLFFDAWLFAKVVQGLTNMASTIKTVLITAIELATGKVKLFGTASTEAAVASEAAATRAGNAWKAAGLLIAGALVAVEADKILPPAPPGDTSIFAKARNELHALAEIVKDPKAALKDLEDEFAHFGDNFDFANSPVKQGWDLFIQGFKDAGNAADSFGDAGIAAVQKVIDKAKEWTGGAWNAVVSATDSATSVIQAVIIKAAEWIGRAWEAVLGARDAASSVIQNVITKAAEWIGRAWEAIVSAKDNAVSVIQTVINKAGEWIGRAWEALVSARDSATQIIQGVINKAAEYIGRAWEAAINARDNASSTIQRIWDSLTRLVSQAWNVVVNTVTGGAGGMIYSRQGMAMAAGGVLPMASGGALRPNMSAGLARIVPPNTWRVIGDRPSGDEAFIPINHSPRSVALLGVTANRMGFGLAPMRRGGYHPRDQRAWDWLEELLRRWRGGPGGGGGGSGAPKVAGTIGTSALQRITSSLAFGGSGGTASYMRTVKAPMTQVLQPAPSVPSAPSHGGGHGGRGGDRTVYIDSNSALVQELMKLIRVEVRKQGGDVQVALGRG